MINHYVLMCALIMSNVNHITVVVILVTVAEQWAERRTQWINMHQACGLTHQWTQLMHHTVEASYWMDMPRCS